MSKFLEKIIGFLSSFLNIRGWILKLLSIFKRLFKSFNRSVRSLKQKQRIRVKLNVFDSLVDKGLVSGDNEELSFPVIALPVLAFATIPTVAVANSLNEGASYKATGKHTPDAGKYTIGALDQKAANVYVASKLTIPVKGTQSDTHHLRKVHPVTGKKNVWHKGVDIAAPVGTPVVAAMDGEVTFTGWVSGYGNMIDITHDNGFLTRYAHLSKIDVNVRQKVKSGDKIGEVGNTGYSTGSHLHFETRYKGQHFNPELLFNFRQGVINSTGISVSGDNDILESSVSITDLRTNRNYSHNKQ